MMVALLGNARWMEEVKPIQNFLRERERLLFSLHGDIEIPGPSALILLPPILNISMCCAQDGQDCIHMFSLGPATMRNHVNINKVFHELRGQKDTTI